MKNSLNAKAMALACGLLWGVSVFLLTFISMKWGYGATLLDVLATLYPKYEVSTIGAFWGIFWGFLDGSIGAYILVHLYNFLNRKLS